MTLSAQSMVECDAHDAGCDGGYLDNAWQFLVARGAASEACVPYRFCANPLAINCSASGGGGQEVLDCLHADRPEAQGRR